jgi:aminoglycoside 3-N-acetyltransferase
MPGVLRSLHPTHSIAATGPCAGHLTAGHELATTPCGEGTPYAKLIDGHCRILFLGTDLDANTIYHSLEAFAHSPYLMRDECEAFTVTDFVGRTRVLPFRRHRSGPARRFAATQAALEARAILRKGSVAGGESLLVEGAPMAKVILGLLRDNPRYLLEQS